MINFFSNIFGYVLNWIYMVVQNYGIAIILFSILIKIVMLPLSISQQKSLKKNEKIQKEMNILKIKHNGDKEKINQELMELSRREKINPFGGCITIIVQLILIISMFYLVSSPLTYMKKIDKETLENRETEIREQYGADKISKTYPEISLIKYAQDKNLKQNDMYINMDFLGVDLNKIPQENLTDVRVYIIPALYVISSIISIKFTNNMTKTNKNDETKETDQDNKKDLDEFSQEEMTAQMNKNMSIMMPILSVSIAFVAPLGLALYWLVNNIIMIFERIILNKFFSKEEEENA